MRKGETQVFIMLGFLGLLFLMPLSGNGADLTVSDVITGNGNMTLNGTMSATSFSGSGSGLTNLDPTKLSSGTANINISGNAATVTNGVYNSGSYADPSWITSLSASKLLSGTANINISGNAATATTATTATTANSVAVNAVTSAAIAFYGNVAVVAPSGGDYTNPATAMGAYSSWCGTPSATNPCLLKIMPGVYDIGTSTVVMQPYIDIEGSGQNVTVITGTVSYGSWPTNGVVNGANNAEIRFLSVKNTGSGAFVAAILNSSASPAMTNVTATGSGGTTVNMGVYNNSSSPTMTNVTATASGGTNNNYGVYNNSSSPTMTNVTATASGGTYSLGVCNNSSSPTMSNVTATASGGTNNYGVYTTTSSPTMTNVTATGKSGTSNYGLYNSGSSTVLIDRSTFDGSTNSIYNESGSVSIGASKLVSAAVGGPGTYQCVGVYTYIGSTLAPVGVNCN